ncbi:hypothetical protein QN382_23770, partial [Pseudomonas sp. 10B1]|nr:hypothetical protein [Pseudomonas sp. 10B1]
IASARELRDAARKLLLAGLDPAAEKKVERITRKIAEDNTFKTIAEEWLAKNEREERAAFTLRKIRWLLDIANPLIGCGPMSKITPLEVLA